MFLLIHFEITRIASHNNNKYTNSETKFPGDFANFQRRCPGFPGGKIIPTEYKGSSVMTTNKVM